MDPSKGAPESQSRTGRASKGRRSSSRTGEINQHRHGRNLITGNEDMLIDVLAEECK